MNTDQLVEYLSALEPDYMTHAFYFSGIHPDGRRIQTYGTVADMLPRLVQRNNEGFGIYICANAIDVPNYDKGFPRRRAKDVTRVRAVFADWDDPRREPPEDWPLPPSMIVETSPGKYHVYWLVEDFPLDQFERAQRGIARTLGTDRSVIDLSREMRLPGLMHTKGKPTLVSLVEYNPHRRYGADEILGAFPMEESRAPLPTTGTPRSRSLMTAAIVAHFRPMRPDGGYNVLCPWSDQHTTASTESTTLYYPPDGEHGPHGYFDCKHAHCLHRKASDYEEWLIGHLRGAVFDPPKRGK